MQGTTTLKLNEPSLLEALQLLVDKTFADPVPKVTNVEIDSKNGGYNANVELVLTLTHSESAP